jgi:hypothetical protein
VRLRVDDTGQPRPGELVVKGQLLPTLTIAGKRPTCTAQLYCRTDLDLKEWVLHLGLLPEEDVPQVRVIPWSRFSDPGGLGPFFERIGVNNIWLPFKRRGAELDQDGLIYLFDGSELKLESREIKPLPVVAPEAVASREIFLKRVRNLYELKFRLSAEPNAAASAGAQQSPAPAARSVLHVVLEPQAVPGWTATRVTERLRKLLEESRAHGVVSAGGQEIQAENQQLEVLGPKVLVWSGELRDGSSVRVDGLPPSVTQEPAGPATPSTMREGRIGVDDRVTRIRIGVPPELLSDNWQFSIKAVNRIYGREEPARPNELCKFKLINRVDDSSPARLTRDGNFLRSTENVIASKLVEARLELEVTPAEGAARCVQQTVALPRSQLTWQMAGNVATVSSTVELMPRGRWFLGLYAPQGIGAGMSEQASEQALFDARNQIIDKMVSWLDLARKRYFAESDPSKAALGFDLALLSGADVARSTPFEEADVIVGQYRQPKVLQFKLDDLGEKRLERFLGGARGGGSAPSLEALGNMIARYSGLFGKLDPEGWAPIVVYVGAGTPNPDSCRDWAQLVANLKPIHVFAIAFVSASAADIRQSLGPRAGAEAANAGTRVVGYACKGESDSVLLFAPFPELLARSPDLVLQGIFDRMDILMARN